MRTLGLLGGMTFESTALYYDIINRHVRSQLGGRHSARLLLYSVDQEPMVQHAMAGRWDKFADVFVKAAENQKAGGAEAIVMCASLAHKVADDVENAVGLPLLHVADFTARGILDKGLNKVALLGTAAVMEGDFMRGRIQKRFGIEVLIPDEEDRKRINDGIVNELTTGKVSDRTKAFLVSMAEDLVGQGAQGLILGSTDLGFVIKEEDVGVPLFDTALLHARGVAAWAIEDEVNVERDEKKD